MYEAKSNEEVVGIISLTNFTELRITNIEDDAIDIRQWYCTQKDPEKKPTHKGIRINKRFLPELIKVLQEQE